MSKCRAVGTILSAVFGLGAVAEARAATITVTTTNTGVSPAGCGLREAIQAVNTQTATGGCPAGNGSFDRIQLPIGILTATAGFTLSRSVELIGGGASQTIIRANLSSGTKLFTINGDSAPGSSSVVFRDLTVDRSAVQGAPAVTGVYVWNTLSTKVVHFLLLRSRVAGHTRGGILSDGGDIEVRDSIIEDNTSSLAGGGVAVFNNGASTGSTNIFHSTIVNNASDGCGGGIHHGAQGNSHLASTTVSGNTAEGGGGGVCVKGKGEYFQVEDATIAFNSTAAAGGGIASSGPVNLYLSNTIVAENAAHLYQDWDGYVTFLSHSLIGDSWGLDILTTEGPSLLDVAPGLDSNLRFHGGAHRMRAHRLLPTSVAIDYFTSTDGAYGDQRHFPKGLEGDGTSGADLWDIGAYEYDRNYHELEESSLAASSGDSLSVLSHSSYSNSGARRLNANAVNDFVTFSMPVHQSGNYMVKVRVSAGTNRGYCQLGVSSSSNGTFTNIGSVQDFYSSTTLYNELTLANSVSLTAGQRYFRFRVTGKNPSSSGYNLYLDSLQLIKL